MHTRSHERFGRTGFTLIELLVVVGIIVVLVGILLPVVGGARDSARAAATRSTIMTVSNAVREFKADKGRLPGFFSVEELAGSGNMEALMQMESSLYELSGGILNEPPTDLSASMFIVRVGSREVIVDVAAMGAQTGPGYLIPTDSFFRVPRPEDLTEDRLNVDAGSEREQLHKMPVIVDGWGVPLVMWAKNEAAGNTAEFAAIHSDAGLKAQFYWRTNRGVLGAPRADGQSLLSGQVATRSPSDMRATLDAVLGHPAFPDKNQTPIRPAAALGEVVFHSAGKDQTFAEQRTTARSYWYAPRRNPDPGANAPDPPEIDLSNDIIVSGG